LVTLNQEINWYPEHIKEGRFGNWLSNNVDWALGRERYWGTPLPVWECQSCHHQECVGSLAELSKFTGRDQSKLDPHRPYVDEVHFACPECKEGAMQRVPELIDVWFDSGSMPVAQWHYPFENQETFEKQFPADFICEAVDQTRGWFYSLHAISTMLFDKPAYKNVICLGLILDGDGYKMSKSRGNFVNPWDVLNQAGADAFRWYLYTASPPGQERRFSVDLVSEVLRNFTLPLWNVYSFFVTYANLDGWKPSDADMAEYSDLDRWLLSELHTLVRQITQALENYDVQGATRPIHAFVVELVSQWYLRRSRKRFWKSTADGDKNAAYATLYEVLVTLSKLLAPTMPFVAEELYQNLVVFANEGQEVPESVHLAAWPAFDPAQIDEALNRSMQTVVHLASLGHAARNLAAIKVRQPLSEMAYSVANREEAEALERFAAVLADELNVKKVSLLGSAGEAVSYSHKPLPKQLGQKYKGQFPKVAQAVLALDAASAARSLMAGEAVEVTVEGEILAVQPDEVEVRAEALSGLTVAQEGAYLAALHTVLTPELEMEGLAREFVRRVQELRKQTGLELADRIHLSVSASPRLAQALKSHQDYIMGETLTTAQDNTPAEDGETMSFDGEVAQVSLKKAS
jgi:isoleucyl-tRNA synthetase